MIERDANGNAIDHDAHLFRPAAKSKADRVVVIAPRVPLPDTYRDDRRFLDETRDPLPQSRLSRRQAQLWREAYESLADAVIGYVRAGPPDRDTAYRSVEHAVGDLMITRVDGYRLRSPANPDRLKQHHDGVYAPRRAPGDSSALQHADRIAAVSGAWERAYAGPWDGRVPEDACRRMFLLRYVGRRTTIEIAEMYGTSQKVAARITRHGRRLLQESLQAREMVPGAEDRGSRTMGRIGGFDLDGWEQIADALGVASSTARRWYARADNPLPVYHFGGRVVARQEEIERWIIRETGAKLPQ